MNAAAAATLVMVPTYNERDLLPRIVPAIRAAVPEATLMVVDDNSPDGTGELANQLAAADAKVRVLHRPGKEGLGAAYSAAFRQVLGRDADPLWQRIVQMDADFSHAPADIPRLLRALDEGADVAV